MLILSSNVHKTYLKKQGTQQCLEITVYTEVCLKKGYFSLQHIPVTGKSSTTSNRIVLINSIATSWFG